MELTCPNCKAIAIKKNGHIHNGKQNYRCLCCGRQFVENPQNKIIPESVVEKIKKALLERVSLEGICRIFDVSMPWLSKLMNKIFVCLPIDLNACVCDEKEELCITTLEVDEQWSFVGNKKNDQWLWIIFHSKTRQVLAFHIGKRDKHAAESLLTKLPEELKKKLFFIQIDF